MVCEKKHWGYNFITNSGVLTFSLWNTVDENVVEGDIKDQRSVHEIVSLTSRAITMKTDFPFSLFESYNCISVGLKLYHTELTQPSKQRGTNFELLSDD